MGFARLVQPHIGSRHSRQPYVWIDPLNEQGRLFSFYCAATVTMALSERMCSTVESVMPKIATQLAHRNSSNPPIDFSTAENWLIRPELVEFIKTAVAKELDEHVSSLVLIASYKEISLLTIRSGFIISKGVLWGSTAISHASQYIQQAVCTHTSCRALTRSGRPRWGGHS
jgi:hypothetical protein